MNKNGRKTDGRKMAAVSTEMAIGIGLAAVAVIVGISMFSGNISDLVANSKIGNLFNGNASRTSYDSFGRQYSNSQSQVEVQIMGEQGLDMLRKRANNKAIEIIQESLSSSNPNGTSIAYLSTAIEALTGETHICVYMKNNSDRHCNEIGGYAYNLSLSGSALTIAKVDTTGTQVSSQFKLPLDAQASAILSSFKVPVDSDGYSKFNENEKYSFIKTLSTNLLSFIRSDVLLVNAATAATTFKTANATSTADSRNAVKAEVESLVNTLSGLASSSHDQCTFKTIIFKIDLDFSNGRSGCGPFFSTGHSFITQHEKNQVNKFAIKVKSNVNAYSGNSSKEIAELFTNSPDLASAIDVLRKDHRNNPNACAVFESEYAKIAGEYGITTAAPECAAY